MVKRALAVLGRAQKLAKRQAEAGVTRAGAEASYKRRLCTSRLSFYLEETCCLACC